MILQSIWMGKSSKKTRRLSGLFGKHMVFQSMLAARQEERFVVIAFLVSQLFTDENPNFLPCQSMAPTSTLNHPS